MVGQELTTQVIIAGQNSFQAAGVLHALIIVTAAVFVIFLVSCGTKRKH